MSPAHRLVDDQGGFDEVVRELIDEPVIGLDTEFHRERSYFPHVAVVQLSWSGGAEIALVDALTVDLSPLSKVLTGPATIVMHAATQDLEVLQRVCGCLPGQLFDTQLAAGFCGWSNPSLTTLVARATGVTLPKGDRLADWMRRPLTEDLRQYAAGDVAYLHATRDWLVDALGKRERLAWAEDECDALLSRAAAGREPNEAWWKVKEARSLRMPAAGIAQELAAWRERRAAETDQPPRFVLPDLALVSIAQRPPRDVAALQRVRGIEDRHLRGGAAQQVLEAVAAGETLSRSDLRLPAAGEVDRELRPAVTLVSAWVSQLGRDLDIDPALLATRGDIEAFLRAEPTARLAHGWRNDAVGAVIKRLVSGDAALAFDGKGGLVLEERSRRSI